MQTTYSDGMQDPGPGTIAGQRDNDRASTGTVESSGGIAMGLAVSRGYLSDRGTVRGGDALDMFKGVSVKDASLVTSQGKYALTNAMTILESGDVWVEPGMAVGIGDPVYFNPQTGVLGNTGGLGPIAGARWKTSCSAHGRAIVSLPTMSPYFTTPDPNYDPIAALGDDLIEMWDAARADSLLVDDNKVTSWLGLKLGSNLGQTTANLKPIYQPTGLAGSPTISFDGTQQYLTCVDSALMTALPDGAEVSEMWALFSQDALPADATERYVCGWCGSSVITGRTISRIVTTSVNRARSRTGIGASATNVNDTLVDLSGVHVVRQQVLATETNVQIDGGAEIDEDAVPSTTNSRFRAGAIPASAPGNYHQGKISMIIVTKQLTTDKANALRAYIG